MSPDPAKPYAGGRDRASVTRMLQFVDNLVWKGLTAAWSGDLSPQEAVDTVVGEMKATMGNKVIIR